MNFLDTDWSMPAPRKGETLLSFIRRLDPKLGEYVARAYELDWFFSNYLMPRELGADPYNPTEDDTARVARIAASIIEQMGVDDGHDCPCYDKGWRDAMEHFGIDEDDEPTGAA